MNSLMVQAGDRLRIVVISQTAAPDSPARPVEIGPMTLADATELLNRYRTADSTDEMEACERVAQRLGRHAFALRLAGQKLRDRHGLVSYADYDRQLNTDPAALASVTSLIRDAVSTLDNTQLLILQLSTLCSAASLPVALIERVVSTLHPAAEGAAATGDALVGLGDRLLATRSGDAWQVHALVCDAVVEFDPPPTAPPSLAAVTAESILVLTTDGATAPNGDASPYLQHAFALAARHDLDADVGEKLLRRAVEHYDGRGQPYLALPGHRLLVARFPDRPAELLAAARAAHQAGESEQAIEYASAVLAQPVDWPHRYHARRIIAEALDTCARFPEADRHWTELEANDNAAELDPAVRLSARVARIRGMRLRGLTGPARQALEGLLTDAARIPEGPAFDELQAAHLELAALQLTTDDQRGARQTALAVLDRYRARGLPHHRHALTAQQIFADAQLTPYFWQLRTDPVTWLAAEATLRRIRDDHRLTHGRRHWFTLTASVAHAHALVSLGEPAKARGAIQAFLSDLVERLGPTHPLHLQACFLLGQAHAQLDEYQQAEALYRTAYEGGITMLNPSHPQILRTQFEYGVALKMNGKSTEAARMFAAVLKAAPHSVGAATDLFWQSIFATGLNLLPTKIWWAARAKPKRR